jgi:hypothetical protein
MRELTFKCLGCKHYLSGDGFQCAEKCPRTENGTEQVYSALKYNSNALKKLEREKANLLKEHVKLLRLLKQRTKKSDPVTYALINNIMERY